MTNSGEDTEGGYTAYPSIPADELEALHQARPHLSPEYVKALIEKYGHTELHSTVDDDMDDFGGLGELGYEEGDLIVDSPDYDHSQCGPDDPCQNDD